MNMASYLPNKLSEAVKTSKGSTVPVYNSTEEMEGALDNTDHLRVWNFRGSKCDRCGISNSKVDGLLIQCGMCKNAHYCSRKCFNDDLEFHQDRCQSSVLKQQPVAGPDVIRRGDDDYELSEEQKVFIQKKDDELAKIRAAKQAEEAKARARRREPSPPPKEEKVRRSWDWDALFGSSNGSSTNNSSTENDLDDDCSVESFAPESCDEGYVELPVTIPSQPCTGHKADPITDTDIEVDSGSPSGGELTAPINPNAEPVVSQEQTHTPEKDDEEDDEDSRLRSKQQEKNDDEDDEDSRIRSKQQNCDEYDDEEIERHRRRVAKILELDAEHRRRLKIGDGDIPQYHWEPEHVKLSEAELIKRIYGWEVPEWVKNRMLRQTVEKAQPQTFSQTPAWALQSPLKRCTPVNRIASNAHSTEKKQPVWATRRTSRPNLEIGETNHVPLLEPARSIVKNGDVTPKQSRDTPVRSNNNSSSNGANWNGFAHAQTKTMPRPFGSKPEWTLRKFDGTSTEKSFSSTPDWATKSPLRKSRLKVGLGIPTSSEEMLGKETAEESRHSPQNEAENKCDNNVDVPASPNRPLATGNDSPCSALCPNNSMSPSDVRNALGDALDESKKFTKIPEWTIRSPLRKNSVKFGLGVANRAAETLKTNIIEASSRGQQCKAESGVEIQGNHPIPTESTKLPTHSSRDMAKGKVGINATITPKTNPKLPEWAVSAPLRKSKTKLRLTIKSNEVDTLKDTASHSAEEAELDRNKSLPLELEMRSEETSVPGILSFVGGRLPVNTSENNCTPRSFSKTPEWAFRSPLRRSSLKMVTETIEPKVASPHQAVAARVDEQLQPKIPDEFLSTTGEAHAATEGEMISKVTFEQPPPVPVDNTGVAATFSPQQRPSQQTSATGKCVIPCRSKSYSQPPVWATKSPLKSHSIANRSPKTIDS
ncbi:hypothetical protein MPSEU_000864100 [Mayamaea pseudoterrestris]|nr:hypothetical protein MPSEU_000864100 [Mayamaea pseudoterrestris]